MLTANLLEENKNKNAFGFVTNKQIITVKAQC